MFLKKGKILKEKDNTEKCKETYVAHACTFTSIHNDFRQGRPVVT